YGLPCQPRPDDSRPAGADTPAVSHGQRRTQSNEVLQRRRVAQPRARRACASSQTAATRSATSAAWAAPAARAALARLGSSRLRPMASSEALAGTMRVERTWGPREASWALGRWAFRNAKAIGATTRTRWAPAA